MRVAFPARHSTYQWQKHRQTQHLGSRPYIIERKIKCLLYILYKKFHEDTQFGYEMARRDDVKHKTNELTHANIYTHT